jgi:hypothetical protein
MSLFLSFFLCIIFSFFIPFVSGLQTSTRSYFLASSIFYPFSSINDGPRPPATHIQTPEPYFSAGGFELHAAGGSRSAPAFSNEGASSAPARPSPSGSRAQRQQRRGRTSGSSAHA